MDPLKSLWQERSQDIWSFYCPVCKTPRRIPYSPRPWQPKYVVRIGLTSAVFTLLCWNFLSWKGLVSFVPFWTIFEILYRGRMRGALLCSQCGFDPYLFLVDSKRARQEVENYWRKKFVEKGIPFPEKAPEAVAKGTAPQQIES